MNPRWRVAIHGSTQVSGHELTTYAHDLWCRCAGFGRQQVVTYILIYILPLLLVLDRSLHITLYLK